MKEDLHTTNKKRLEAFRVVQGGKTVRPKRFKLHRHQVVALMLTCVIAFGLCFWVGVATILNILLGD